MKYQFSNLQHITYFRFLNLWVNQNGFIDIVKKVWKNNIQGNTMWRLQSKLKILSKHLSQWSRTNIGDVNENTIKWENELQNLEEIDIQENTDQSR